MKDIVHHIFKVIKLKLEVTQIGLNTLNQIDLTEKSVEDVSFEASCRHIAPYLSQNSYISYWVKYIELLKWVWLLLNNQYFLGILYIEIDLVGDLKFALYSPNSLQALERELSWVLTDDWPCELNHIVFFDEGDKRDDHIDYWYFVVDVK